MEQAKNDLENEDIQRHLSSQKKLLEIQNLTLIESLRKKKHSEEELLVMVNAKKGSVEFEQTKLTMMSTLAFLRHFGKPR